VEGTARRPVWRTPGVPVRCSVRRNRRGRGAGRPGHAGDSPIQNPWSLKPL